MHLHLGSFTWAPASLCQPMMVDNKPTFMKRRMVWELHFIFNLYNLSGKYCSQSIARTISSSGKCNTCLSTSSWVTRHHATPWDGFLVLHLLIVQSHSLCHNLEQIFITAIWLFQRSQLSYSKNQTTCMSKLNSACRDEYEHHALMMKWWGVSVLHR